MHFSRFLPFFVLALGWIAALPVAALRAAEGGGLLQVKYGDQALTITAADLAALPHAEFAAVNGHTKETHRYTGVPVRLLLAKVGAPLAEKLRGKAMQLTVLVRAADGYAVVFALSQFDERFTDRTIYLVDREDGKPLDAKAGPLGLVIAGDQAPARWARMVTAIEVR